MPCEWIVPVGLQGGDRSPVVIYLHGGGYIAGSPKSHRVLGSQLAKAAKARVLLVNYPLAPEAAFPVALEEIIRLYQWLLEVRSIDPSQIAFAGDSAGAGLVLQAMVHLQYGPLPQPSCAVPCRHGSALTRACRRWRRSTSTKIATTLVQSCSSPPVEPTWEWNCAITGNVLSARMRRQRSRRILTDR